MKCFKKYDVRGVVDSELTEQGARSIGAALGQVLNATTAVVGGDARESTPRLKNAVINGLLGRGVKVFDIGQTGTEEVYFACQYLGTDVGIEVTASHNPIEYNGIKFVAKGSRPLSDTEFQSVKELAGDGVKPSEGKPGQLEKYDHLDTYIEHLFSYISVSTISKFKIVVNAGNGVAGHVIDAIEAKFEELNVPVEFVKIFHQPDSTFPNGIPNPLLPEDRWKTAEKVKEVNADFGVAWDGDFDRCFLFDENGEFVDGYYIVGLLAKSFLQDNPGEKVVHDPRVFWNTLDVVEKSSGTAVKSATGHALIKAKMRECDAIYGGEMSAHHYFKSFGYCDSGMIPWLLVLKLLSNCGQSLSALLTQMQSAFPSSGEMNFRVRDAEETMKQVKDYFLTSSLEHDDFDGLSMSFSDWRFNLRSSATEPLLRLNVETRNNKPLLNEKTEEIKGIIAKFSQ